MKAQLPQPSASSFTCNMIVPGLALLDASQHTTGVKQLTIPQVLNGTDVFHFCNESMMNIKLTI